MKEELNTELKAIHVIAEILMKYAQLHVLNINVRDWKELHEVRQRLEKVIHENGYRMNYDKNIKNNIIKL